MAQTGFDLAVTGTVAAVVTGVIGIVGRYQSHHDEPTTIEAFSRLNAAQAAEITRLQAEVRAVRLEMEEQVRHCHDELAALRGLYTDLQEHLATLRREKEGSA